MIVSVISGGRVGELGDCGGAERVLRTVVRRRVMRWVSERNWAERGWEGLVEGEREVWLR